MIRKEKPIRSKSSQFEIIIIKENVLFVRDLIGFDFKLSFAKRAGLDQVEWTPIEICIAVDLISNQRCSFKAAISKWDKMRSIFVDDWPTAKKKWEWSGKHGKYDSMSILFEITTLEKYGLCTGTGQFLHMAVSRNHFLAWGLKMHRSTNKRISINYHGKNTSLDVL